MRNSRPIDALLSRTMQGILATTLMQPERWWCLTDLAKHLRRPPSSLQRPLASLVRGGILRRKKEGNRVYFQLEPACPLIPELRGLMAKTVGLVDVLQAVFAPLARDIRAAFVYGSVARAEETADSDIDLMVIGALGLAELTPALQEAEERLSRPVNATVYTPAEFAQKVATRNHFVTAVLAKPKLIVLGTEHELEQVARRGAR
jgi:predicted nucleotidyltransferase